MDKYNKCKVIEFEEKNEKLLSDKIFLSFKKKNLYLYEKTLKNPTNKNKEELEKAFKQHYFNIRFTSYLSKTIHFTAINFDKKERDFQSKNKLLLDQNVFSDSSSLQNHLDFLTEDSRLVQPEAAYEDCLTDVTQILSNQKLQSAYLKLTDNQKRIINLSYIYGLQDIEISILLNKSQQAVSKSHKNALKILHKSL